MAYYEVLKGIDFYYPDLPEQYSYTYNWINTLENWGFKIYLRNINTNRLFLLTLNDLMEYEFNLELNLRKEYVKSKLCNITLEETNSDVVLNIKDYYIPKDKTNSIIFILEGNSSYGDINNHLFCINQYGNPDSYNYSGWFVIHNQHWELVNLNSEKK